VIHKSKATRFFLKTFCNTKAYQPKEVFAMRKKVCAVAMSLMLALLVGYSFADDDEDDNGNYYSLSFQGTGQDACKLTNVDDPDDPQEEFCGECDNGCGESFIFYELNLTVMYNRVFGKLEWYGCWTKDSTGEFKCNDPIQSRLKDGRLLKDKRFGNTYISFAVKSEFVTGVPDCPADNNRDYFMLLAIKDDSGNIIRLEGGSTAFSEEDCSGWEAAEITRVVLHSY
jgi:hypothetical protein